MLLVLVHRTDPIVRHDIMLEAENMEPCIPDAGTSESPLAVLCFSRAAQVVSYNTLIKAFAQRANYAGACQAFESVRKRAKASESERKRSVF